ncbi:MAG TPA: arginine--tRNA ligase [Solirubrobacteraceae bacterium]|jgi:arginyl-tRNA synthetase|nr:arginine--tRNA ligase [Solirubrobacteraceae bacterium]
MSPERDPDADAGQAPLAQLTYAVAAVALELAPAGEGRPLSLERPPNAELGDYSTNAALVLASAARTSPRELAQGIGAGLAERLHGRLTRFEVAGPGFLNLHLDDDWHRQSLAAVLAVGQRFGAGGALRERILVEFVSANPTGPMHVGHARNAAYGDSLSRLLAFHGHDVDREFYVNDAGSQVRKLGESIQALARGQQVPQDGYQGEYVQELVAKVPDAATIDPGEVGRAAVAAMVGQIEGSLHRFGVLGYDHWQYESALHEAHGDLLGRDGQPVSAVQHALELLEDAGHTYRSEGALWLRSTDFGDDKDRVLVRGSGEHTYFASDIAYHQAKRERGFTRQIDVWGADHHGYIQRMRAAYEALGGDPQELEMLIMQLVHLMRKGQRAQMSKRSGEFVTLDDLVEEIGVDAARWYLLSRSHDTTIDLDLDLAMRQSSDNPVYYVQYAHARIASMLAKAGEGRVQEALAHAAAGAANTYGEALHSSERDAIKQLLDFPAEVAEAAARRAPHRITTYALQLAQTFTAFYRDCRVVGAQPQEVESTRIGLCVAVQRALASSLDLLGVSAPQEM